MPDRSRSRRRFLWGRGWRRCIWCGGHLSQSSLTCDHWVPRSQGGTDRRSNIVAACLACNGARGSRAWAPHSAVAAWAMRRGLLPTGPPGAGILRGSGAGRPPPPLNTPFAALGAVDA